MFYTLTQKQLKKSPLQKLSSLKAGSEVVVQHVYNLYLYSSGGKNGVRTQGGRKGKILPRHSSLAGTKYTYIYM